MDWTAMTRPWLEAEPGIEAAHSRVLDGLMDRAALEPGQKIVDVGCGCGGSLLRAGAQVGPAGRVIGVDIAPPMVARAAKRVRGPVDVVVGDAQTFAFEAGAYDAAISLFGVMFFQDTEAAFRNIHSALRPGGRLVFASWASPADNPWFGIGRRIATARLGDVPPRDPTAPGPFAFAETARVLGLLEAAGFEAGVETVSMELTPHGPPEAVAGLQMKIGAGAMVMGEKDHSKADADAIRSALREAFAELEGEDGQVRVPARIHYYSAVVP